MGAKRDTLRTRKHTYRGLSGWLVTGSPTGDNRSVSIFTRAERDARAIIAAMRRDGIHAKIGHLVR